MKGRKPYIPHRHPELLGMRRLWDGGGDDMDFPVVAAPGCREQYQPPSYLNATVAVDGEVFTLYEDPEEEMLVIESTRGAMSRRELEALIASRPVSCRCGATFDTLSAALEHAAGEKHSSLIVQQDLR